MFFLQATVAVGITALSGEDMYMAAGHGKCVEVFHVIGDMLCQLGKPPLKPDLGPANDNLTSISGNAESNNQQTIVNQTEILPVKLEQLDIGEDSKDVTEDETISKVNMSAIFLTQRDENKIVAFIIFRNIWKKQKT